MGGSPLEMFLYRNRQKEHGDCIGSRIPAESKSPPWLYLWIDGAAHAASMSWGALAKSGLAELEPLGRRPSEHERARYGASAAHVRPRVYGLDVMQGGLACTRPAVLPLDICAELSPAPAARPGHHAVNLRVLLAEASELPAVDFLLCATAPLPPQLGDRSRGAFRSAASRDLRCTEGRADRGPAPTQPRSGAPCPA